LGFASGYSNEVIDLSKHQVLPPVPSKAKPKLSEEKIEPKARPTLSLPMALLKQEGLAAECFDLVYFLDWQEHRPVTQVCST